MTMYHDISIKLTEPFFLETPKVDFGDFSFMRIEPKVVRYVSGVATAFLGSGGILLLLLVNSYAIQFTYSLKSPFAEFSKEEYQAAKVDPIAQYAKPVTV